MQAREIAERFVRETQQFKENNGINLKITSFGEEDSNGCRAIELSFDFQPDKNLPALRKAFVLLKMCNEEISEYALSLSGKKTVEEGNTVKVHYIGWLDDGNVFDSSLKRGPLEFKVGAGEVINGFEKTVIGMQIGEEKRIHLEPEEAYGPRNPELERVVMRSQIKTKNELKPGMIIALNQPDGSQIPVTVLEVSDKLVTIDLNPPLAGKALNFWIKVVKIEK